MTHVKIMIGLPDKNGFQLENFSDDNNMIMNYYNTAIVMLSYLLRPTGCSICKSVIQTIFLTSYHSNEFKILGFQCDYLSVLGFECSLLQIGFGIFPSPYRVFNVVSSSNHWSSMLRAARFP